MDAHGLTQFKLEQDDTKLELKKGGEMNVEAIQRLLAFSAPAMADSGPMRVGPSSAGPLAGGVSEGGLPSGIEEIKAPIVGTCYAAPRPDEPDFVKVGDRVEEDTTVCIIEAMKVFNDIKAEIRGEIVEVLFDNGTPVQYGEPLFRVKTS